MKKKPKGNGREKTQTKMVSIYWAPEFIERMDAVATALGRTRNDFIKESVGKHLVEQEKEILQIG